ncbi:undecaprenyl-diphosphate phosphatase [Ruminococcus difficilis]|uniref:Undecaprenyl-diphosphatase n=1 Tax=Ruminococcus difficilis TaxID=2763069 RepID=A0A934TYB1_9FIRM|nr:undecaprenyl-diphosphate phosphatase [Ruminococcus difficilis]MBK6087401.1 undecaprenyl-diphosphate phosphatase [Ruminococcus difficilis]
MTIIEAIIQGVVQGLTEFLPVSSSGHLTITQHVLGINLEGNNLFFNVMLHIGTLAAVIVFYHKLIWRLIKAFFSIIGDIFTGKFKWKELSDDKRMVIMVIIGLLPLFLLFIPIPGTDMKLKDFVEGIADSERNFIIVGICLLITSILLFIGNRVSHSTVPMKHAKKGGETGRTSLNVVDAIVVGITQCFATMPGISRSGSTLAAGQMRGLDKQTALDYTFILGTPAIVAAAVLEGKDALEGGFDAIKADLVPILIGMVVSAVVGYLAIALFKWLLKTDKMIIFIVYTAVIGIAVIVISIIELSKGVNIFSGTPLT